jgi:hypothetical protein
MSELSGNPSIITLTSPIRPHINSVPDKMLLNKPRHASLTSNLRQLKAEANQRPPILSQLNPVQTIIKRMKRFSYTFLSALISIAT